MKNRNFTILWVRDALLAAAASLTSVSVLSGHLLFTGMAESKVSFYLAFVPLVNLAVSLLFSGISARTEKTVAAYSALCLAAGLLTAVYVPVFKAAGGENALFVCIMALGSLVTAVTAVRTIFDYKLPCEVMELDTYSLYVSVSGIAGGVSGICAGALLTFGYKKLPFTNATCAAYICAAVCLCAAAAINKTLKKLPTASKREANAANGAGVKALMKNRQFRILIIPNLLRGIGMAVVPMITLVAVNAGVIGETDGAAVTVCTYAATLVSCVLYAYLAPRLKASRLLIAGALLFCALVPCLAGGKIPFFICYTAAYIGYYAVSCAIPDLVYRNAPTEIMSVFHTWRLALSTVGTTAATAVFGRLIGKVPSVWLIAAGCVTHIFCAAVYYAVYAQSEKNRRTAK